MAFHTLRSVGRHGCGLAIGAGLALTTLSFQAAAAPEANAVVAMREFLSQQPIAHQYSASRRLEASGCGQRGWLDVQTNFTPEAGLSYEVTAEGGSGFIRSRVLRSLLDEEQRLIARKGGPAVALSTDNYEFEPETVDTEGLAIVRLMPRRKERALIIGRMFLSPLNGDLSRVEGRLAKTPSFWISRVNVVRSYGRINGVLMPVLLETNAQLRFFGSSEMRMTYRYTRIDDRPVAE
jgi:hypothetical protein